ncbi:MAG: RlmI/RlmK family 23S rRNA methyltransferase, partial [Gammaproteobacteria bacterium]
GVGARVATLEGEAFQVLEALRGEGERFDLVILDPPAFIKRRKDQAAGEAAYHRLHRLALQVLAPGGVVVAASCSFHYSEEALRLSLLKASRRLGRGLQILERGHQGPDHPVHPAIPETAYLKALLCRAWEEPGELR